MMGEILDEKILLEEPPASSVPDLFSPADLSQMAELGIDPAEALRQIELFRNPPPFTHVLRACRVGDGIRQLSKASEPWLLARFEEAVRRGRIAKLVPASGAATRMFKELLADLNDGESSSEVRTFLDNLPRFAFYEDLADVRTADRRTILEYLLTEKGLN